MVAKLRERFYWPTCKDDVEYWICRYVTCTATKGPQTSCEVKCTNGYHVGHPFERIAVDLAGLFPMSWRGNRHIACGGQLLQQMVSSISSANRRCPKNCPGFCKKLDLTLWCPLELHTDQGRNLRSNLFSEMCKLLKDNMTRTTALHPQLDKIVEWFNRSLLQHLSKGVDRHRRLEPQYFTIYVSISIFVSWEHSAYASQGDVWPWVEIATWLGIWNTAWDVDTYLRICHRDEKPPKENLQNCEKLITSCIRLDVDSVVYNLLCYRANTVYSSMEHSPKELHVTYKPMSDEHTRWPIFINTEQSMPFYYQVSVAGWLSSSLAVYFLNWKSWVRIPVKTNIFKTGT